MKCCFLMTLACAVPALGQMMYNPPAAGGAPAASPASPPAVQPNAYQPSRQGDAKSLYGNELPFLNPQDGTVTINGTTLNMGSFREIEARFNKYLSQPEESTEDAKEYQKIFEKLHETLSMRKEKLAADNVVRQVVDRRFQQSAGRRRFRRSLPSHLHRVAGQEQWEKQGEDA
jgi:vancomycin resistance protein YoaR